MTSRHTRLWGVACLSLFSTPDAFAQCGSGYVGLELMLRQKSVAIVFMGTVASVERAGSTESVTFDVDRSWKGAVKRRTTIYRPIPVNRRDAGIPIGTGSPIVFDRGKRYVVIAHSLRAEERTALRIPERQDAFG